VSASEGPRVDYVLPLADERAALAMAGGKGASLARLVRAGLPVPPGFHVTTAAYRQFVAENGLQARILQALEAVVPADTASLDRASQAIGDLFLAGRVPDAVAQAVSRAYAALPGEGPAVAVRSSATAEDLPDLSFAGQQETYLNICGGEAVLQAMQRCWASLWTARAIGYRAQHKIDSATVALAVVVQALVPADCAGILFTANPLNGRRDQAVINAAWGLGEAIVGGLVTPDTLVVDRGAGKVLSRETPAKALMTLRTETGTVEGPVPAALQRAAVLDDAAALELTRLGERIEALYGTPMDIEWARAGGQFAILQARPVTALPAPAADEPAPPLTWPLPDPKARYARSSILELLPDPMTPLFAGLGLQAINQGYVRLGEEIFHVKNVFGENMVIQINDYGYYSLRFSARQILIILARVLPAFSWVLRTAETRWKNHALPAYAAVVERWQTADLGQMPAQALLQGVREILYAAIDHYQSIQAGILPAAYLSETLLTQYYDRLVRKPGDPTALTFVLGFDSQPIRAEKSLYDLAQWSGQQPALAAFLSATPAKQIAAALAQETPTAPVPSGDWNGFRARFSAHLAQFGHGIYDLDFAKPVAADDPAPLLETMKHLMGGRTANPYVRQQEAAARRTAAVERIETRLKGLKLRWFRRLFDWAQRYAPLREDALADVGLGWPPLRKMLLELGDRLAAHEAVARRDDIFWLDEAELVALAAALDAGAPTLADQGPAVAERRARLQAEKRVTPPPVLPQRGRWVGMDLEKFAPAKTGQGAGNKIVGIGSSPGQVTATARVLRGPEDFSQMQQGDVLVAAITTPAWTPLFALASAVVTDIGGPLSHSSIVAREYAIPAVLGTGVATHRIQSGQRVMVDGSRGEVTLLP